MPERDLPQPPKVEELPPASPGASAGVVADTTQPPAGAPLYFPDEPKSFGGGLGGLILVVLLFYFFAPASWKGWVKEQWEKLPVEVSVKMKEAPVATVTPTPAPWPPAPPLYEASPALSPFVPPPSPPGQ